MEDGLTQLLFFLFIIVASIVDAATRSKKKRQQMEEMEQQEAEESGVAVEGEAPPAPRPARRRPRPVGEAGEEEEMADSMLPDELWAILTGKDPSTRRSPRAPAPETGAPAPEPEAPVPVRSEPTPVRVEVESPRPPPAPAPASASGEATTRRSSRWMSGLEDRSSGSDRWSGGMDAEPEVVELSLEEPWAHMEDITAGEIGADEAGSGTEPGGVPGASVSSYGKPGGLRLSGKGSSPYVRLLRDGRSEALKEAVVLREVLGEPKGWREDSDIPGLR